MAAVIGGGAVANLSSAPGSRLASYSGDSRYHTRALDQGKNVNFMRMERETCRMRTAKTDGSRLNKTVLNTDCRKRHCS